MLRKLNEFVLSHMDAELSYIVDESIASLFEKSETRSVRKGDLADMIIKQTFETLCGRIENLAEHFSQEEIFNAGMNAFYANESKTFDSYKCDIVESVLIYIGSCTIGIQRSEKSISLRNYSRSMGMPSDIDESGFCNPIKIKIENENHFD